MVILLFTIGEYCGYWWLLMTIILMDIGGCYINGYWWLFRYNPLVVTNTYFINDY
jgi:hypothetical protein